MSFDCERSCSSAGEYQISKNSKVPHGSTDPHIKFERDRLNIFRVIVFTSSGSTCSGRRGGDDKTIISPYTSFGDIMIMKWKNHKDRS